LNPIANDYHLLLLNALYPIPASQVEEAHCRFLIEQLGLLGQVTFITDYLPDHEIRGMLSQADVLVFPYQHTQESSSAAVRVGLSAGCKVAVTPLSIFSDVEEAVYRMPGITPDEIALGLEALLNDDDEEGDKRVEIETWFAERDWRRLSTRLLNMLDSIANPLRL
jgi:glycosyltransferase involved in cell wall biosynthesis